MEHGVQHERSFRFGVWHTCAKRVPDLPRESQCAIGIGEVNLVFEPLDEDKSGRVSLDEFMKMAMDHTVTWEDASFFGVFHGVFKYA